MHHISPFIGEINPSHFLQTGMDHFLFFATTATVEEQIFTSDQD